MKSLLLLLISAHLVAHSESNVECVGPEHAKSFYVFLHGSYVAGTADEQQSRKVLNQVGVKLGVRFAMPKAQVQCDYDGKRTCWLDGKERDRATYKLQNDIEEAAKVCFHGESYGLLGFSNGGNFVNSILKSCARNNYTRLISIGAGGARYPEDPPTLEGCKPALTILAGDTDGVGGANARAMYKMFLGLHARVRLQSYSGGHQVLYEPLVRALSESGD